MQRALGSTGIFVFIGQVASNVTTFTDSTAKAGKTYRYRVQAYNAAGSSSWSNVVSVRARH